MNAAQMECPRPEALAKSLLEVWLSGDRRRLRMELENMSFLTPPPETNVEFERIDLLKCVAWRMKESAALLTPYSEDPRIKIWFDLLRHLATRRDYESAGSVPGGFPI